MDEEKHPRIITTCRLLAHRAVHIPGLDIAAGSQAESPQVFQGPVKALAVRQI